METVKATTKQKSDRAKVEDLLAQSNKDQRKINSLAAKMQQREQEIMELAEKHPEWFDGKTANLENGVLKYEAKSKAIVPENVDLDELSEKYPSLIQLKYAVPVGKLRTFLDDLIQGEQLRKLGFDVESEDKFKVIPNG